MANTGEYNWRYWRFVNCNGKSLILDFNNDSTWRQPPTFDNVSQEQHTRGAIYIMNDGDRLLDLFNDGVLADGDYIKLPKSENCYRIYGLGKTEVSDIENRQRYGEYLSSPVFWESPANLFNENTLPMAFNELEDGSVIVCGTINVSHYESCECIDPNDYNSIELHDICGTGSIRFVKVDSFRYVEGFEFGNYYYITCFDTPSVYQVVSYSMHEVNVDYPVVLPDCVTEIQEDEIDGICSEKHHFVGCETDDIYSIHAESSVRLVIGKYYTIDGHCYRYEGKEQHAYTNESVAISDVAFIDCGCTTSWNGKFESCDGEHIIVINVPNRFREQLVENEYYTIGDLAVIRIGGTLVKNCFRFIGYTNDEVNSTILMNKMKACDPQNCSSMYISARIISCVEGYDEKVWVTSEVLDTLYSLESNTFTYDGHRCCYFEYDMGTATSEEPVGGIIVTMEDISDITTDCVECKNNLIDSGLATCLVIHPCDCDKDYYISLQDMDSDEINKLIEHLSGKYISFMALGKRTCGLVENDCSSVTNGLDTSLVIEPANITGCYFSCEECYNADTDTPVPVYEQVTGRVVEPGYNANDLYHCVYYESCCCDNEDINDENLNL